MTDRTGLMTSPALPGPRLQGPTVPWPRAVPDRPRIQAGGHPGRWLALSLAALGLLSASAAVVSFAAQYGMVRAARGGLVVPALEAAIPDTAAVTFAALGIALALHGRRAVRVRLLNLAAVGTSLAMNVLAAGHGWRDAAIWVMPPAAYALASDTAIGVIRAWAVARQRQLDTALDDDTATPLALAGGLVLWLLRLVLAPASTLAGFRRWVIEECPVAPGRRAPAPAPRPGPPSLRLSPAGSRTDTKTARFLDLVTERHGPLAGFPLDAVSRVSAELAPGADLHPGAARAALRRHVQAARSGPAAPSEKRNI
jgi:hypothetical protein